MGLRLWATLLLLPVTSLTWLLYRLSTNYSAALPIGVPIVVIPVNPESPLWMLTSDAIGPLFYPILKLLPFRWARWFVRYAPRGWDVKDKAKTFLELGDAWVLVTTGKNWLYVCNAESVSEMLVRRKEFERPLEIMAVLDVFGPNLSTVEGRDWQRHRKATSPPFGEPNMPLVWTSCISQAHEMLSYWASLPSNSQTGKDVRRFSLHVLTATGFGKPYHFDRSVDEALPKDGSLSYKDSLSLILENCILIMLLGPKLLTGKLQRFLPKQWRLVGKATNTFKTHIASSIKEEKALIAAGKSNSGNFINAMVRASEEEAKSSTTGAQKGLSETEIFGNIFVFNFAGHDSIAITLTYVITHLAANPEVQDWIAEEINHVFRHKGYTSYKDAFPRLKRCTAVVYETLRTSTPFPALTKCTGAQPRTLRVGSKILSLPAGMNLISTFPSMHAHPRYWGPDVDIWNPHRWIKTSSFRPLQDSEINEVNSVFDEEELWKPPPGVFIPWSEGERACPGKKFAQVELTGAVCALFGEFRVEPVPVGGESMENARERTKEMIGDSGMVLLVEMLHPEKVGLRWVKRDD